MKYEDWIKYEQKRKKGARGAMSLFNVNKAQGARKKAPNREIVTHPKRRSLIDVFRRMFNSL